MKSETWIALARVATLCNRAQFLKGQEQVPILKRDTAGELSIKRCLFVSYIIKIYEVAV